MSTSGVSELQTAFKQEVLCSSTAVESLFQSLSRHSRGHKHRLRKCLPNSNFLTKWEPRGSLTELKSHHANCSLALCRARSQTPPHHLSYLIHHQLGEVGIITACTQGRKWKIREVNRLVQGHQLAKGKSPTYT